MTTWLELEAAARLQRAHDVADLLPVDDRAASEAAVGFTRLADALVEAAAGVRGLEHVPEWRGDAGRAFERHLARLPGRTDDAALVFGSVARALHELATVAGSCRADAARALHLHRLAVTTSARWHDAVAAGQGGAPPAGPDPGVALAEEAVAIYAHVLSRVGAAAEHAQRTLSLGAASASSPREWLGGPGVAETLTSFTAGTVDSARATVQLVWDGNPVRAAVDPDGFSDDLHEVVDGVVALQRSGQLTPWGMTAIAFDLDGMADDPAYWFGNVFGLSIVTGGLGLAGRSGATARTTRAAVATTAATRLPSIDRVADVLGRVETAAAVRAHAARTTVQPTRVERLGYVARWGGDPDDYERRVATIAVDDDGGELTFEFLHDTVRDHIHEPTIVQGEVCVDE